MTVETASSGAVIAAIVATLILATTPPVDATHTAPSDPQNCGEGGQTYSTDLWGPTDVNAQLGNQNLTVGINPEGTVNLFKWPQPSYYDQIHYYGVNRSQPRMGTHVNAGAFLGIVAKKKAVDVGEVGTVNVSADTDAWQTAELRGNYDSPIVIARPPSYEEPDRAHTRIRNIVNDTFEIQMEEWDYHVQNAPDDGLHANETAGYVALERGSHYLQNGTKAEAGRVKTDEEWLRVTFDHSYSEAPVVLTQTQSYDTGKMWANRSASQVTRREVDSDGFWVKIQEQESDGDHSEQMISYVVFERDQAESGGVPFEASYTDSRHDHNWSRAQFDRSFTDTPVFTAATQTYNDSDPGALRYRNLNSTGVDLHVEEERSATADVTVEPEEVGYLAFEQPTDILAKQTQVDWLREWDNNRYYVDPSKANGEINQEYLDNLSDTILTSYRSPDLGLSIEVMDTLDHERDVFHRNVTVDRDPDSPVSEAELIAYENYALTAHKDGHNPTQDWCFDNENTDDAWYNSTIDAITHFRPYDDNDEVDISVAMGFKEQSDQHQVGGDASYENAPGDAYQDAQNGVLSGSDSSSGQNTGALTKQLEFQGDRATADVYMVATHSTPETHNSSIADVMQYARSKSAQQRRTEKRDWYRNTKGLADAPIPDTNNTNITQLSYRSLVTLTQVTRDGVAGVTRRPRENQSLSIVAAAATQAPYGLDWVRDGAYFNLVHNRILGNNRTVSRHNKWYQLLQKPNNNHLLSIDMPDGSWAMNYYSDGLEGGPIPHEIDQDSYGVWNFYNHYKTTKNDTYLKRVWPEINRTAEYLVNCKDQDTGLQCAASEDDQLEDTQTLVGAASVYGGLESAVSAAESMYYITGDGKYLDKRRTFMRRRDELGTAIEEHLWNESHAPRGGYGQEPTGYFGGGPRLHSPACFEPFDDPRMAAHLDSMWEREKLNFEDKTYTGQYEVKEINAWAEAWQDNDTKMNQRVKPALDWVSGNVVTNDTYIMGEQWVRAWWEGGDIMDQQVETTVAPPHTWNLLFVYIASLKAYPPSNSVYEKFNKCETKWRKDDGKVLNLYQQDTGVVNEDVINASVEVENTGTETQNFSVEYEVVDIFGDAHDGERKVVELTPGEVRNVSLAWEKSGSAPSGPYDVRGNIWRQTTEREWMHTLFDRDSQEEAFILVTGETGRATVTAADTSTGDPGPFQTVSLNGSYSNPVVVAHPITYNGNNEYLHSRLGGVGSGSFDIQIEEWDYDGTNDAGDFAQDVGYIAMEQGNYTFPSGQKIEVGTVQAQGYQGGSWDTASFQRTFDETPVVLAQSQQDENSGCFGSPNEAAVTRINDVTTNGFDVKIREQESGGPCAGSDHPYETVGYIAIEPGEGEVVDATGKHEIYNTPYAVNDSWFGLSFNQSYDSAPVFTAQTQTFVGPSGDSSCGGENNPDTHALRRDSLDQNGVQFFAEEEESCDSELTHRDEQTGYMAFENVDWIITASTDKHATIEIVEQDRGLYARHDVVHATANVTNVGSSESTFYVNYTAVDESGSKFPGNGSQVTLAAGESRNVSLEYVVGENDPFETYDGRADVWQETEVEKLSTSLDNDTRVDAFNVTDDIGYVGRVEVWADDEQAGGAGEFQTVSYPYEFTDPIVIAQPISYEGADPAHARIQNVQTDSFEIQVEEWDENIDAGNGAHAVENVTYIVIERGDHRLPNGTLIEAETTSAEDAWGSADFSHSFSSAPATISMSQQDKGGGAFGDIYDSVVTRQKNVDSTGFNVKLQDQEGGTAVDGDHPNETIGYIGVEPNSSENAGMLFDSGKVQEVDDEWKTVAFGQDLSEPDPQFVSWIETYNDNDTAELRYDHAALNSGSVDVFVEEEQSADNEMTHGNETVGYVAFEREGRLYAQQP